MVVVAADNRHNNSKYEALLELGRELALKGEIDKGDVQEWARNNYSMSRKAD